jgi:arginine/lysine/ornithine decarboxylase
LTHKATLAQSGSVEKLSESATLADAIEQHCVKEKASFHTPGHKGGTHFRCGQNLWAMDVTELPGLDELAYASGVLARVQERAAQLFGAGASFISTNGASAALMAAIAACASRGTHILVPRNVHRSAVNALVLTGLEPVWYEPVFDARWNIWGEVDAKVIAEHIQNAPSKPAAVVVTSPTYAGAISDIAAIAQVCHSRDIALIVDEAHGAHAPHAVAAGADVVVHSLHKTLSAMTQTGMAHVRQESLVEPEDVRLALNMLQSSSPNYVLMASIESALAEVATKRNVERALEIAREAQSRLAAHGASLYTPSLHDPLHVLLKVENFAPELLFQELAKHGVYAESILGEGVLLLFGCGSTAQDIEILINALEQIRLSSSRGTNTEPVRSLPANGYGIQVLSPKLAYFGTTEVIPREDAIGRIAAECVAPCPPGNPVVVPGQRITAAALDFCKLPVLRVVVESQQGEQ